MLTVLFHLNTKSGPNRGMSWPISGPRTLVGRDLSCDVVVLDPLLSREHFELRLEGDVLSLTDLGGRNATIVNGSVVRTTELQPGDEILAGQFLFQISRTPLPPEDRHEVAAHETKSITDQDALYLRRGSSVGTAEHDIRQLLDLFDLSRTLPLKQSANDVLEYAHCWVQVHFGGSGLYATRFRGDLAGMRDIHGVRPEPLNHGHLENVRENNNALSIPYRVESGGPNTLLVAPLAISEIPFGVVATTPTKNGVVLNERDLALFLSFARTLAPCLLAIEHHEQLIRTLQGIAQDSYDALPLLGKSPHINMVRESIAAAARDDLPVLLLGETGTGKDLVAQTIHGKSARSEHPFVAVNCAAVPVELFESELFGHEKGAFTGADRRRRGRVEQAMGGTLFLDEVAELSLENQAKLLRFAEAQEYQPLGSDQTRVADVRIVAATNQDLAKSVHESKFRADLYYRLCVHAIQLAPLRDRREDILLLAEHFLAQATARVSARQCVLSTDGHVHLENYPWPGNVRELKNTVTRAAMVSRDGYVGPEELTLQSGLFPHTHAQLEVLPLQLVERQHILTVLEQCNFKVEDAAKILGIGRTTLYSKIKEYDLRK